MNPLQDAITRESQDEKNATDTILRRLAGLWLEGGRIFLKWLRYSICFMILLVPFNALCTWINPTGIGPLKNDGLNVPALVNLILAILYLPIAGWLASKLNRLTFTWRRTE